MCRIWRQKERRRRPLGVAAAPDQGCVLGANRGDGRVSYSLGLQVGLGRQVGERQCDRLRITADGRESAGVEGVVVKHREHGYRPRRRSWWKVRTRVTADAVVGGVIDPATRSFTVETEFANRDGKLRPGLFARVEMSPNAQTR